jgi:hypothetical protein
VASIFATPEVSHQERSQEVVALNWAENNIKNATKGFDQAYGFRLSHSI